jgi:hypothetical protein
MGQAGFAQAGSGITRMLPVAGGLLLFLTVVLVSLGLGSRNACGVLELCRQALCRL